MAHFKLNRLQRMYTHKMSTKRQVRNDNPGKKHPHPVV